MPWIGVFIAIFGLIYTGMKDYQSGSIKIPVISYVQKKTEQPIKYDYQYCLMCYDPNIDKVYYQHEDGSWRDYAPQQKKIPPMH